MSPKRLITAFSALLLAALFLVSCSDSNVDGETLSGAVEVSSPEWSTAQIFTVAPSTVPQGDAEPLSQTGGDGDSELAKQTIAEAMQVYSLFSSSIPQIDTSSPVEYEDGVVYYRVTDTQLDTFEKLRSYIEGYFAADICDLLMNIGRYIDIDGALYVIDVSMPGNASVLSEEYAVTSDTDTQQVFTVTVSRDNDGDGAQDASESYEFVRENRDGKWIFTKFPFYK